MEIANKNAFGASEKDAEKDAEKGAGKSTEKQAASSGSGSANIGITANNTDLPIMLGFIALAVAGLVVVMFRRREDQ